VGVIRGEFANTNPATLWISERVKTRHADSDSYYWRVAVGQGVAYPRLLEVTF